MIRDSNLPIPAEGFPGRSHVRSRKQEWTVITVAMHIFIFLVVFTAYNPLAVVIGGLNVRASQLFLPVALMILSMGAKIRQRKREFRMFLAGLILWGAFLFWTLVNLYSSASPVPALAHVGLIGLNLVHAVVAYLLILRTQQWRQAIFTFLICVTFFNLILVIISVANAAGFASFGTFLRPEASPLLEDGQLSGGDADRFLVGVVTGNLSVGALFIAISLLLRRRSGWSVWLWATVGISIIGLILGFSRQSIISAAGGAIVLIAFIVRSGRARLLLVFGRVIVIAGVIGYLVSAIPVIQSYFQAFAGRAVSLGESSGYTSGTSRDRIAMWSGMLGDFWNNPFVGAGQDAYMKYYPSMTGGGSHSFPIEILHATGLTGFLPYLYLHVLVFAGAWRALVSGKPEDPDRWLLLGCTAAFVVVWLASFTNLIFWGPQYWVLLGMVVAISRILTDQSRLQPDYW